MAETINQIYKDIESKKLSPIYLLSGEETYYIDLIADKFENTLMPEESRDFNQTVLYGESTSANEIVSVCRQYPLMSDLRLVIIKEAQILDKREWTKLSVYFSAPLSSTILVICNKNKTFDIKTKNIITKNKGVVFDSKKVSDSGLGKWIKEYVKEKGFVIDEQSITLISEYLGNNLQKIDNELKKLILNIKDRKNITTEDITNNIGISKDYNVFELEKALATKNVFKANQIISYFEKNQKANPIQLIIPNLFSFFVKVFIASQTQTHTPQEIAQALGFSNSYFAQDYIKAITYYSSQQIISIIKLFEEYDMKTKGMNVSPLTTEGDLLKELIFKIIHI